jgi:hypothetical protein
VFDIVAADQNETATAIDVGGIDDGESGLPAARAAAEAVGAEPAHQPGREADQRQDDNEGGDKLCRLRHVGKHFEHLSRSV